MIALYNLLSSTALSCGALTLRHSEQQPRVEDAVLPPLHLHPHLLAIRAELDPAVQIGAQQVVAIHCF